MEALPIEPADSSKTASRPDLEALPIEPAADNSKSASRRLNLLLTAPRAHPGDTDTARAESSTDGTDGSSKSASRRLNLLTAPNLEALETLSVSSDRWNRWKLQERIQAIPTRAELEPTAIEELDVISKWKLYRWKL